MPPPRRPAGGRLPHWGSAALLSVGLHALALLAWWQWAQGDGPLSRARRLGVPSRVHLSVHLVPAGSRVEPATRRAPAMHAAMAPHGAAPAPTAGAAATAPPLDAATHMPALPGQQETATPAGATTLPPPLTRPGGRFAGLFAPITTQALGRGQWGADAPRPPPDEAAQGWREQQAMVLAGEALRERVQTWLQRLHSPSGQALLAHCDLRMSLRAHSTVVSCEDATDQARMDQELGGASAGVPTPASDAPADVQCLHVEGQHADWVNCPDAVAGAR
jgi:hypothetical protein